MAWSAPRTWVTGELVTSTIMNQHVRDNLLAAHADGVDYTPAWTSTGTAPALGNGTITGRYLRAGDLIVVKVHLTMGSTTTYGTGDWRFSIPANAVGLYWRGVAEFIDTSASTGYGGACRIESSTTISVFSYAVSGSLIAEAFVAATIPYTWANTDQLRLTLAYEATP